MRRSWPWRRSASGCMTPLCPLEQTQVSVGLDAAVAVENKMRFSEMIKFA